MREIFSERTFIDVFCLKVSIVLIKNSVLTKNLKLPGHFDETAIFDNLPILHLLLFAIISTQLGLQTGVNNEVMISY